MWKRRISVGAPFLAVWLIALGVFGLCAGVLGAADAGDATDQPNAEQPVLERSFVATSPHIVLAATASRTERHAADELRVYLGRLFGVAATLGEAPRADAAPTLYLGRQPANAALLETLTARFGERHLDARGDSFALDLAADGGAVHLVGLGDRGTLYAAYELLERLGCRWLEPGPRGEYVPRLQTAAGDGAPTAPTPATLRFSALPYLWTPVFAVRSIGTSGPWPDPVNLEPEKALQTVDWMVRNRLNKSFALRPGRLYPLMPAGEKDPWGERGGIVEWQHIAHNTTFMMPNERYFEAHPEYYSLYHGKRLPIGAESGYLCTTNPAVQSLVADYANHWFDEHPAGSVVPVIPPDGAVKWCECEACSALGGRNFTPGPGGSMTRRQVAFVSAVAAKVAEKHPDRLLLNLAYSRYTTPYEGLEVPSNVVVQVAHGYAGNGSFVRPIGEPINTEAREIFEQWAASGAGGIGIWDYFMLHVASIGGSAKTPLGLAYVAADMVRYLASLEPAYKVYFTQAGNELWEHNTFLYYAVARLVRDPATPLEALYTDFAATVFGPAAEPAAAYLRDLDAAYRDATAWHPAYWGHITVPSPKVFTPAAMARLATHLAALDAAVPADATQARDLLRRWHESLDYVTNTVEPKRLLGDDGVWRLERGADAYVFNSSAGAPNDAEVSAVRDRALAAKGMDPALEKLLFRCRYRAEPIVWLENDALRLGILPGVGGRLLRLIDRRTGLNLLNEPSTAMLEDPGVGYFRYGGYEEYTTKYFASTGWELPMAVTARSDDADTAIGQPSWIELSGEQDGVRLVRRVQLDAAGGVSITSTLTNLGDKPRPSMIRVHPEFSLGGELDNVYWLHQTGSTQPGETVASALHAQPILGVGDSASYTPVGTVGAANPAAQVALLQHFGATTGSTHLHVDREAGSFNLELFGQPVTLAPGESTSLSHRYEVISGEAPFAARLPVHFAPIAPPTPPRTETLPGQVGEAVRLLDSPLRLAAVPQAIDAAGTVEGWFSLPPDTAPADIENGVLFSFGTKQPDHLVVALRAGTLVAYRHSGTAPYDGPGESWLKLSADVRELEPGSWHHVAFVWSRDGDATTGAYAALYLDGRAVDTRADARMQPLRYAPWFVLGGDASHAALPPWPGALDEWRVSSLPHGTEAIRAAWEAGRARQPLAWLADTVLLLHADGDLDSERPVKAKASTPNARAEAHAVLKPVH